MSVRYWLLALTCAFPFVGSRVAQAEQTAGKEMSFGTLAAPDPEKARSQSLDWLKGVGKTDETTMKQFEALWAKTDRPLLERVAGTIALGDAEAAKILAEARDPLAPAPTKVPPLLQDATRPAFYRANLALDYAKALSNRRDYEHALEALRPIKPEHVVDPAGYYFHRAVAEHALLLKNEASRSIVGVLEDVADAPERYRMVAVLMLYDMQNWRDKDLGEIARKMDNIERRLELARGGPQTQKIQKEVVARLDELIKKLENQKKGNCQCNGGSCPGSQPPQGSGGNGQGSPMTDSGIAILPGQGIVGQKRLTDLAKQWGQLPEKERTKAMQDLTRSMPPRHRELIETYFKKISQVPQNLP